MYWVYPRVCGGTGLRDEDVRTFWGLSPRVRGNPPNVADVSLMPGLSPRVRGNLPAAACSPAHVGSIPACAGEPQHRQR